MPRHPYAERESPGQVLHSCCQIELLGRADFGFGIQAPASQRRLAIAEERSVEQPATSEVGQDCMWPSVMHAHNPRGDERRHDKHDEQRDTTHG